MENIELVIKIPKKLVCEGFERPFTEEEKNILIRAIGNATPLPKGHGDLIDVNRKITVPIYDEQYEEWGEETLTVLEALNRWSDEGVKVEDVVIWGIALDDTEEARER